MNRRTNISPEEFEKAERYILKNMAQDEYEEYTVTILNDPDLQNKMETIRLTLIGIQEAVLSQKMDVYHNDLPFLKMNKKEPLRKVSFMKNWMMAASILIILGFSAFLFFNKSTKQEKLYTEYFKPDPGLITAMSITDNYLFEHAMIDYKTKKYDNALNTWNKLLLIDPKNDTLNYFIGSALLAENKITEAIPFLEKVTEHAGSYFMKDAYWYLGLALISQEKISEAIPYIEKSAHQNKNAVLLKLKKY